MRRRLFAALYDRFEHRERAATARHREHLLEGLSGRVLEIGAGTGANFGFYPAGVEVTAVDDNPHMLRRAEDAALDAPVSVHLERADAMTLPFGDASFDAVVSGLVLCSVPEQSQVLAEIRRVLQPGGALRLFEHVRSERAVVAASQRLVSAAWATLCDGCHLDRDTEAAVRRAGFALDRVEPIEDRLPLRRLLLFAHRPD